jgi:formate-dependent nitrite reductase cytochrome c552 subunit
MKRDVKEYDRDIFESSLQLGVKTLCQLGYSRYQAHRLARTFRDHHNRIVEELFQHYGEDEKLYLSEAKRHASELEGLLQTESEESIHESDGAWDVTSIKEEIREIFAEIEKDQGKG